MWCPEPLLQFRSWMASKVNRMSIRFSRERKLSIRRCPPRGHWGSSLFLFSHFAVTKSWVLVCVPTWGSPWPLTAQLTHRGLRLQKPWAQWPLHLLKLTHISYFVTAMENWPTQSHLLSQKQPNVFFFFIWFYYLWGATGFRNFNLKAVILESSFLRPPQDNVLGGVESQLLFGREASLTLWAQLFGYKLCNLKILLLALECICLYIGILCKSSVQNS